MVGTPRGGGDGEAVGDGVVVVMAGDRRPWGWWRWWGCEGTMGTWGWWWWWWGCWGPPRGGEDGEAMGDGVVVGMAGDPGPVGMEGM